MKQKVPAELKNQLHELYDRKSKHSSYQSIPEFVAVSLGYDESIIREWRDDKNRLAYILSKLAPSAGESWGDFGANTGFFTYTLANLQNQANFVAIEANKSHAKFLRLIKKSFQINNVEIIEKSIGSDQINEIGIFDVLLHLNVLHHAGADFDTQYVFDVQTFLEYAVRYLKKLKSVTKTMVFQMGSNLWGDKLKPIVHFSDDLAKLKLFSSLIFSTGFQIKHLAYPKKMENGAIEYIDFPNEMIHLLRFGNEEHRAVGVKEILESYNLDQHIGEFYRRPLFICERT
jgi:hypothetical protein